MIVDMIASGGFHIHMNRACRKIVSYIITLCHIIQCYAVFILCCTVFCYMVLFYMVLYCIRNFAQPIKTLSKNLLRQA